MLTTWTQRLAAQEPKAWKTAQRESGKKQTNKQTNKQDALCTQSILLLWHLTSATLDFTVVYNMKQKANCATQGEFHKRVFKKP